ncbi:MAG: hypothetical protein CVT94_08945 [Bacteroidetes bacterium HGW-Bacteroidetes-11]|jgi:hypothetical protein|nr:MAG: hypothetical protein CVT94_08945 [Bacteroidetes bacterium HGW-Bacteroidetes-11]
MFHAFMGLWMIHILTQPYLINCIYDYVKKDFIVVTKLIRLSFDDISEAHRFPASLLPELVLSEKKSILLQESEKRNTFAKVLAGKRVGELSLSITTRFLDSGAKCRLMQA